MICPSFTYHATAEMVALLGATPIIADVAARDLQSRSGKLRARRRDRASGHGLKPRAIIPVDLFGLPADHDAIAAIAATHGLLVLDDAAQAFGATYRGKKLGTLSTATATSFFPAKPLGCYGDGGAVFTDDDALAARIKSIRLHGEGVDRSEAARIGITGRLDTIQAAVLIEKLKIFPDEIVARNRVAARYAQGPRRRRDRAAHRQRVRPRSGRNTPSGSSPAGAMGSPPRSRPQGIPTAIYYTKPLHRQPAYRDYPIADGGVPVSEQLSGEVISLPMHAYLEPPVQDRIIAAVRRALAG